MTKELLEVFISVRVTPGLRDWIDQRAKVEGRRKRADMVRVLLERCKVAQDRKDRERIIE